MTTLAPFAGIIEDCERTAQALQEHLDTFLPISEELQESVSRFATACHELDHGRWDPGHFMDIICEVDKVASKAVAALGECSKFGLIVCSLIRELSKAVLNTFEQQAQQLQEWEALAEYRDHARGFCTLIVRRLGTTWDSLSLDLCLEEQLPNEQQTTTLRVQHKLLEIGFSWMEWELLCYVADASSTKLLGRTSVQAALTKVATVNMPASLERFREPLKKALVFIKSQQMNWARQERY